MASRPLKYGGRQWVTMEAERDVRPSIEDTVKAQLKQAVERDGMRLITEPEIRWHEIWRLKRHDPALGIPDMLRDDDFELRVWAYAEPA